MNFTVIIDPRAIQDVQKGIDYYEEQQVGLGKKFEKKLDKYLLKLETNPFFAVRYDNVRCLPLKKIPYMIHFTIDEKNNLVTVQAVFHTSLNPDKWDERKQ